MLLQTLTPPPLLEGDEEGCLEGEGGRGEGGGGRGAGSKGECGADRIGGGCEVDMLAAWQYLPEEDPGAQFTCFTGTKYCGV